MIIKAQESMKNQLQYQIKLIACENEGLKKQNKELKYSLDRIKEELSRIKEER